MSKSNTFLYLFIPFSYVSTWLVNYYFSYASLWVLLLIPAVSIVALVPKWKTAIVIGIINTVVMATTEILVHFKEHTLLEHVEHLAVSGIVGWVLFLFISYLRITNAKLVQELEKLALTDPLTKIYNRRYLNLHMERALPLAKREKSPLTIVMLDIDYFKKINDSHGHDAGDTILKKLVKIIKKEIRESDILVRLGGEEFLIVLASTSLKQGHELSERIRETVENEAFVYEKKRIPVTISMGIAQFNEVHDLHDFINKADQALYRAKENGRNQVIVAK